MFNLILDKEVVNQFKAQRKTRKSELKEKLNQAIETARKKGIKEFVIKFNKPTYYSIINRHLKELNVEWSGKYDGYRITAILIKL